VNSRPPGLNKRAKSAESVARRGQVGTLYRGEVRDRARLDERVARCVRPALLVALALTVLPGLARPIQAQGITPKAPLDFAGPLAISTGSFPEGCEYLPRSPVLLAQNIPNYCSTRRARAGRGSHP